MSVDNLRLLTSDQALADLAHFRNYIAGYIPNYPGSDQLSKPPLSLPVKVGTDAPWVVSICSCTVARALTKTLTHTISH